MRAKTKDRKDTNAPGHAGRVDVRRLVQLYGAETASEVLRKLVIAYARDEGRGASRRTR
jgi:hypothetical protein